MSIEDIINCKVNKAQSGLSIFKKKFKKYLSADVHIILMPEYELSYLRCIMDNFDYIYISNQFKSICLGIDERFMSILSDSPFKAQNNSADIISLTESECQNIIALSNLFVYSSQVSVIAFNSLNYRDCYDCIKLEDRILYGALNISPFFRRIARYTIGDELNFKAAGEGDYLARGVSSKEELGAWALEETDLYLELNNYIEGSDIIVTIYFSRVLNFYQKVLVLVNGQALPQHKIMSSRLQFCIPSAYVLHSKLSIKFVWPLASTIGNDTRMLSVMLKKMVLTLRQKNIN